jgi:3-(3-hydroxy-phenyl)propionate hydroxylase
MRPAGRGPLESLYFSYPIFEPRDVPGLWGVREQHPVVIVGAGPIGMTAALTLAHYGIKSVLLDRKNTFNDGSRAICIARPSIQIFERIGVVQPFLRKALGWTRGRSYYRDKEIYQFEMPHSANDKYLPMYNLQQQYIEQYLYDAIAAQPLIDMRWCSEVTSATQSADGAKLEVTSPVGSYLVGAEYVIAADGARSAVRSLMGLRLKGENYEGRYVIADVKMAHDFPTERRAFFAPKSNPGGTVLVHKQPDDIWRVDYQLKAGESAEQATEETEIRRRVAAILEDIGHTGVWDLEWWSVYTANTLALNDYKHGRIIFIGDSAHIVPIFGVRGLNNGVADAHNIGWKLAYVLNGIATPSLLESYSPERRGATLDVFANATKSTRFMTPPTRGWQVVREAALSLATSQEFAKRFADPRQMQPYTYADGPLTSAAAADLNAIVATPGTHGPDVKLQDGSFLLDRAGKGFTALIFAGAPLSSEQSQLLGQMKSSDPNLTAIEFNLSGDGVAVAEAYGAQMGTVILLRPDLHILGRWESLRGALEALRIVLKGAPS